MRLLPGAAKEPYADNLIDHLTATYAPDLKQKILKPVVHSPVDLERRIVARALGDHPSDFHGTAATY